MLQFGRRGCETVAVKNFALLINDKYNMSTFCKLKNIFNLEPMCVSVSDRILNYLFTAKVSNFHLIGVLWCDGAPEK